MSAVVIIRHGDTEWSRTHRHTGRTDLPLTPEGEAQVRPLRRRLAMLPVAPFTQVWTSPLRRASDTCALAGTNRRACRCARLRNSAPRRLGRAVLARTSTLRAGSEVDWIARQRRRAV